MRKAFDDLGDDFDLCWEDIDFTDDGAAICGAHYAHLFKALLTLPWPVKKSFGTNAGTCSQAREENATAQATIQKPAKPYPNFP